MLRITDILTPKQVILELAATTAEAAIVEVAQRLRLDPRVSDWGQFVEALKVGNSCVTNENGYGIAIPHARTPHVSSMVMATGRSRAGIYFPEAEVRVHYLFVIGVPGALAQDYLRLIGALARTFRSPKSEASLRDVKTPEEFIALLSASEMSR